MPVRYAVGATAWRCRCLRVLPNRLREATGSIAWDSGTPARLLLAAVRAAAGEAAAIIEAITVACGACTERVRCTSSGMSRHLGS